MGINNDLNSYPFLQKKVEDDEKIINNQFTEYLNKVKSEKENNNIIENNENGKNNLIKIKNQGIKTLTNMLPTRPKQPWLQRRKPC